MLERQGASVFWGYRYELPGSQSIHSQAISVSLWSGWLIRTVLASVDCLEDCSHLTMFIDQIWSFSPRWLITSCIHWAKETGVKWKQRSHCSITIGCSQVQVKSQCMLAKQCLSPCYSLTFECTFSLLKQEVFLCELTSL